MTATLVDVFGAFSLTTSSNTRDHMPSDLTCAGDADSLQRYGATVPLDHFVHLSGVRDY